MTDREFGDAGDTTLLEELLDGEEASILAFCDGERFLMMPSSQDHKRIGEGDTGPNTGGMGAYSPAPVVTAELEKHIADNIIAPVLKTMADQGAPYRGILYAGLMIGNDGAKVLEFNCRFGDPECQPIMARLQSDIVPVLMACAEGDLSDQEPVWSDEATVCVVMASGGYPGKYGKGIAISGIEAANEVDDVVVFHAGTKPDGDNVVTSGGRVLGVTAKGANVKTAIDRAYEAVEKITWDGAVYRRDIGHRAISR
jgi:phosphoribosylamine--glycine ligase